MGFEGSGCPPGPKWLPCLPTSVSYDDLSKPGVGVGTVNESPHHPKGMEKTLLGQKIADREEQKFEVASFRKQN